MVDDRRRDDRSGSGVQNRRFEDRKYPEALKPEGGSPNYQKDVDGSSPPVIRPVRDILGDDAPPLLVGEPHKSNGTKAGDNTPHTQVDISILLEQKFCMELLIEEFVRMAEGRFMTAPPTQQYTYS